MTRPAALGLAMALATLLPGCTVGPDFTPPAPPKAGHFPDPSVRAGAHVTEAANPDPNWWNGFDDPVLTRLIGAAIAGNTDLKVSILRVTAAHQQVVAAAAEGLPTLGGNASYMRNLLGVKGIVESQGAYADLNRLADAGSPANRAVPGLGTEIANAGNGLIDGISQPVNLYQWGFSSSWELDLFGRVRRSVEAARASAAAQAEATADALVMLESEVAGAYFQLRAAQALAVQQQRNVQSAQDSLELAQSRSNAGLSSDADVEQARTQLLDEKAQQPAYEKEVSQAMDRLALLAGKPPGALDTLLAAPAPLPMPPGTIGIGVPSTLARRRPDIREAEAELHAATAQVGVAVASFYPDISLTGSLGLRATDASFLTNWASLFYAAGPSVSLPIFEGGKLTANLRMARAQQASAAIAYRGTVLNALREVEDALVAYRTDRSTEADTAGTVQAAALSLHLAESRYRHGLASYLPALDAERTLVSARQQLIQAKAALDQDAVALYTALGGGWQEAGKALAAPGAAPGAAPRVDGAPPPLPAALDSVPADIEN